MTDDIGWKIYLTRWKTHTTPPRKPISNAQNPFLMPQKLFSYSNLKPRKRMLTLRGFYHPNIEKKYSDAGKDYSKARPMGLTVTRLVIHT
jgi:hypothetical protein